MKKICIYSGYYPIYRGGSEYQAYLLGRELKKYHKVFFISDDNENEEVIEDDGITIYKLNPPKLFNRRIFFLQKNKIIKILKVMDPDIIYVRRTNSTLGYLMKYYSNNPDKVFWHVSSDIHTLPFSKIKLSKFYLFDLLEKRKCEQGIQQVKKVIVQSEQQENNLKSFYKKENITLIRNFWANGFNIKKEPPLKVLWIANYKPLKQPELFIELSKKFEKELDVEFIMAGRLPNGDESDLFNYLISTSINLKVMGELPIDQVNDLLSRSHILVNTSIMEGFPNSFIQAWLNEVVVVSLNVDPDDILKNEKIGFHSGSFEQMVKDVKLLISNEKLRHEMAVRSRVYAEKHFDLNTNLKKLAALFN